MTNEERLYDLLLKQAGLLGRKLTKDEWLVITRGFLGTLGKERRKAAVSDDAQEIYDLYPKKVAPLEALTAITAALKTNTKEYLVGKTSLFAECVRSWPSSYRYFQDGGDRCPNPASWFNAGRYADDPKEWRRAGARNAPDRPYVPPSTLSDDDRKAMEVSDAEYTKRLLESPEPPAESLEHAFWLEARRNAAVNTVVSSAESIPKQADAEVRLRNA